MGITISLGRVTIVLVIMIVIFKELANADYFPAFTEIFYEISETLRCVVVVFVGIHATALTYAIWAYYRWLKSNT